MAIITLEYGEQVSIPWTIAADITGKQVVFAVSENPVGARVLRKTSADDVAITQSTPTGVGTIAIKTTDFSSSKLQVRSYYYSLWYQTAGDDTTRVHVAKGVLTVDWTVSASP